MPRQLRREYAGAIYHVMNRGDGREEIFRDLADRRRFLAALTEACGKTQWQIHAYCLMSNHFHLVLETPDANLVAGMKWLLGVYTKRFNLRHKESGIFSPGVTKPCRWTAAGSLQPTHYGAERREVQTSRALRFLREEMDRLGWEAADLHEAGKSDERKVRLAVRIRKETTMSLNWIAENLAMASWTHVPNLPGAQRKRESLKSEN
jgi:REP element-mobilizing transposase RayT